MNPQYKKVCVCSMKSTHRIAMSSSELIPTAPVHVLPALAGLICGHSNCSALFSDLDKSISHAEECHSGNHVVKTCSIQEVKNESGDTTLVLVSEELEQTGQ